MPIQPIAQPTIRCAGPNCGVVKGQSDRWWLMWTSRDSAGMPALHLAPWDDKVAEAESAMAVCGELCAQKLQSQFMGNVLQPRLKPR
jgi:hypothetical protein